MAKYSISAQKNLIKITQKSMKKLPVNERERAVFQENLLPGLFRPAMEGKHRIIYTAPQSVSLSRYIRKGLNVHRFYSIVAQVVEMIVPDNKSLAARVTPAVDCSHILAVQDHVMEQVVLDHAVQRGLRIARNGEVQRDVRDVIDLIAGEGILHTAKLHTAFVERAVLVRIVDAAV